MTVSYMRPDTVCDKVDALIGVVYYAFRDEFTHPFIKARPPHTWHQYRALFLPNLGKINMWVGLVQRIRTKHLNTASSSSRGRSKQDV